LPSARCATTSGPLRVSKVEKIVKMHGGGGGTVGESETASGRRGFAPRQAGAAPIVSLPILPHERTVGVLAHISCNADTAAVRRVERCCRVVLRHDYRP
jgi:hypothetical protein